MRASTDYDPLTAALAPPPGETLEQRALRLRVELEAKQRSDEIDEALKVDKLALKRRRKATKVLLLGQAESGESLEKLIRRLPSLTNSRLPRSDRKINDAEK